MPSCAVNPPAPAPADAADAADTADATAKPSQSVASKTKQRTVEVFGALKTGIGDDPALTVYILDAKSAAPVTGLALTVDYTHTAMGHGGSKLPKATEASDGRYQLSGLVATMAGSWRVTLDFAGDSAAFDVEVE